MIQLENGKRVLAEIVNDEFDVDGKRRGAGIVVAYDRADNDGTKLYVTWTVYPTRDDDGLWIAETGYYGQTWDEAMVDMVERFKRYGFDREVTNGRTA